MQKIKVLFTVLVLLGSLAVTLNMPTRLGLDLQGGMQLILEGQDSEARKVDDDGILGAMEVIRNRIDSLGLTEPIIRRKGLGQIIIELPGIDTPERAVKLIGETALLEFVEGEWAPPGIEKLSEEKRKTLTGENAKIEMVSEYDNNGELTSQRPIILRKTLLNGSLLKSATPGTSQHGEPLVFIEFNKEGAEAFYKATLQNMGKPLAILLDGKIISAPNIREPIQGGRAQISGSFSIREMRDLVIKLKAGALPIPMEILSQKVIGPSLGKDSIEKSKKAALIGLLLVSIYMVFSYHLAGLMATGALFSYLIIAIASLKLLGATLTLPGLAGLILTIGMAVDANVIIFERVKEELQKGLHILPAIRSGFNQAFITIVDANTTTLIAATVLFWLGTGSIKGFAVTLSIGIIVSMFSALFITKILLQGLAKLLKNKPTLIIKVKS